MSKSLSEFKRFLTKEQSGLSEYEKKLSRLVLDNFASIEAVGSAAGQRGKVVAKLIRDYGESVEALAKSSV